MTKKITWLRQSLALIALASTCCTLNPVPSKKAPVRATAAPVQPQRKPSVIAGTKQPAPVQPLRKFLLISDVHLDPLYEVMGLLQSNRAQGTQLFANLALPRSSSTTSPAESARLAAIYQQQSLTFAPYGWDSNVCLFQSALDAAQKSIPNPDFILFPGDFLAHYLQSNFLQANQRYQGSITPLLPGGEVHTSNIENYQDFINCTLQFMVDEFKKRFGTTPILPAIGNNDAYCGDYVVVPDGKFLKALADIWIRAGLLPASVDTALFKTTFCHGGYYTADLPTLPTHRIIVLNSILFSPSYSTFCTSDTAAQPSTDNIAQDQLTWFTDQLKRASSDNKTVWLMMHIPPGIDAYSSYKNYVSYGDPEPVPLWQDAYFQQFLQILDKSPATVQIAFAGHEHMDDFRVATTPSGKKLLTKVAPSISPIFNNNPGYQVYSYDPTTGAIPTYTTYYLTNLMGSSGGTLATAGRWAYEYDFATTYKAQGLLPASISSMLNTATGAHNFANFYTMRASTLSDTRLPYYTCACQSNPSAYTACLPANA